MLTKLHERSEGNLSTLQMKQGLTLRELIFAGTNFRVFGCQTRKLVPQNAIFAENLKYP